VKGYAEAKGFDHAENFDKIVRWSSLPLPHPASQSVSPANLP